MGKKRSDALYNRMRNGKEDLEKYYKEREWFFNEITCKGLDLLELEDQEYMKDAINKINSETQDRINREHFEENRIRTRASLGTVCEFVGSSILPVEKGRYDKKWIAKFKELGNQMEEKSQALKKEREEKAQQELEEEEEAVKYKRPKLTDVVDKAKLKCEIVKWKKLTRIATVFIQMMTLWIIAHLGVSLFMHIVYELKPDLIKIILLGGGLGIGMLIHWALNKKIESLMVKACAKDKEWAERIREELKGWDLSC